MTNEREKVMGAKNAASDLQLNTVNSCDMERIRQQMGDFLIPEKIPISYVIEESKYTGIPALFQPSCEIHEKENGQRDYIITGKNEDLGLEIQTTITEYKNYPVYDIVTWFRACGTKNTPMLREIKGFDGMFHGEKAVLYTNSGDFYSANGYEQTAQPYTHEMWTRITPQGGRCCDQAFPYFKVQFDGFGLNLAVGWPGQWAAEFGTAEHGILFSAGQEITDLYLMPGEKIRTPKVTVMAYDGSYERGVNIWRRWYCEHILPRPNGKCIEPQLVATYAGDGSCPEYLGATEENQLEHIEEYVRTKVPYSLWWIDAGWYECDTDDPEIKLGRAWQQTGTWKVDRKRFPNGLMPISKKLAEHDMKLLLWFEPERVRPGSEIYEEHSEWLLSVDGDIKDGNCGYHRNLLLNLGIPECTDWLIEKIDTLIKENGVGIYRQDYNFPPLRYWRENESYTRRGMTENLYIQGYFRYWDTLLERNPGLWIDACASGGRRNDLETMRRAVPLHPTDYGYGYHHISQAFARTLAEWFPYYRMFAADWSDDEGNYPEVCPNKKADYYTYIASLSACLQVDMIKGSPEEKLVGEIWKRASKIMVACDYYPLSETSKKQDQFCVNQYYRPEEGKGYIQAVRHAQCPQNMFCARLRDIEDEKTYLFDDMRTGQTIQISGKQLNEAGFQIILQKRDAAVWFYEIMETQE